MEPLNEPPGTERLDASDFPPPSQALVRRIYTVVRFDQPRVLNLTEFSPTLSVITVPGATRPASSSAGVPNVSAAAARA